MNSKVRVMADAAGNVVVPSKNNSEWGHIRVTQDRMVIDDRGFARKRTLSALIPGTVNDLKGFGWKKDQEVEGTVFFKEQLEPFNKKDPDRDFKKAGKTDVVCCIDGQPIYRKTFYSQLPQVTDEHILDDEGYPLSHDNVDDIRAAYIELEEKARQEVEHMGGM
jgi:hypothetical protein